jgi:hypothetical protein
MQPTRSISYARAGGFDIIALLGTIVLISSIALSIAVYLYTQLTQQQISAKAGDLQRNQKQFQTELITEIARTDARINSAREVLEGHIAPSALFQVLEQLTLDTISFSTMQFDARDPNKITVLMKGKARSINSIALQADVFSKHGAVTNPLFSNISRSADGVAFDLTADVNPKSLSWIALTGGAITTAPQAQGDQAQQGVSGQLQLQKPVQQPTQVQPQTQTTPENGDPFGNGGTSLPVQEATNIQAPSTTTPSQTQLPKPPVSKTTPAPSTKPQPIPGFE